MHLASSFNTLCSMLCISCRISARRWRDEGKSLFSSFILETCSAIYVSSASATKTERTNLLV